MILPENDKPCLRVIQNQNPTDREMIMDLMECYGKDDPKKQMETKFILKYLNDDVKHFIEQDPETFFNEAE